MLHRNGSLYKGIKFNNIKYVGDSHNAIRVFNNKEVDELLLLDITATSENRRPDSNFIQRIADECYVPFGVGGGIRSIEDIKRVLNSGAEKVSINTYAVENPDFITQAANYFGSQSIVVSIDYKSNIFNKPKVYSHSGRKKTRLDPIQWGRAVEKLGAGEILFNNISREGTGVGLDIDYIKKVTQSLSIPIIGSGGIGSYEDIISGIKTDELSAIGVGSLFIFHGSHRTVLINYPNFSDINTNVHLNNN